MNSRKRPANLGGFIFGLVLCIGMSAFTVYLAATGQLFDETRRLPYYIGGPLAALCFASVAVHSWFRSKSKK